MKGSAPGTVSSVRPAREFGALARNDGVSGTPIGGDRPERRDVHGSFHVHTGECVSWIEEILRFSIAGSGGGACFWSMAVPRHDSISSSSRGVAERWPNGLRPWQNRHVRKIAAAINKRPTKPRTDERTMIKLRCAEDEVTDDEVSGDEVAGDKVAEIVVFIVEAMLL